MSEFIWQNHYRIGNQKVDQQHQQLFNLANHLVQSKTQADLAERSTQLYHHVREHFQCEEQFMKLHGYPDHQQHAKLHKLMLAKLEDVTGKIDRHEWQQNDVLLFMREWISHTLEDDAAFNAYFQDCPTRQLGDNAIDQAFIITTTAEFRS